MEYLPQINLNLEGTRIVDGLCLQICIDTECRDRAAKVKWPACDKLTLQVSHLQRVRPIKCITSGHVIFYVNCDWCTMWLSQANDVGPVTVVRLYV